MKRVFADTAYFVALVRKRDHAVRAFESNALDYLLKPYSDERLEVTLARARTRLAERQVHDLGQSVLRLVSGEAANERYLDWIVLKSTGVAHLVRSSEVDWIEGAGVHVYLHVAGKALLHRTSLNELEARLDPRRFVRVHRSAIVNIDSIVRLERHSHGEFDLLLKNGGCARVSRTYRAQLERELGQALQPNALVVAGVPGEYIQPVGAFQGYRRRLVRHLSVAPPPSLIAAEERAIGDAATRNNSAADRPVGWTAP